jgi:hypothetical protein
VIRVWPCPPPLCLPSCRAPARHPPLPSSWSAAPKLQRVDVRPMRFHAIRRRHPNPPPAHALKLQGVGLNGVHLRPSAVAQAGPEPVCPPVPWQLASAIQYHRPRRAWQSNSVHTRCRSRCRDSCANRANPHAAGVQSRGPTGPFTVAMAELRPRPTADPRMGAARRWRRPWGRSSTTSSLDRQPRSCCRDSCAQRATLPPLSYRYSNI